MRLRPWVLASALTLVSPVMVLAQVDYRLLATSKTSTAEKEINEAADAGYRFAAVMGGQTGFGGSEVVIIMQRSAEDQKGRFGYKLLATTKTSTMQKEMQEAGDAGYEYKGQTVYRSLLGGKEAVVILEVDKDSKERPSYEYRLLATKKTSTLQKEMAEAGAAGYEFVGLTVADTGIAGAEVISILRKAR